MEREVVSQLRAQLDASLLETQSLKELVNRLCKERSCIPSVDPRSQPDDVSVAETDIAEEENVLESEYTTDQCAELAVPLPSQPREAISSEDSSATSARTTGNDYSHELAATGIDKGSYVRAAGKVYWVSYEDPLEVVRLPDGAESVKTSSTGFPHSLSSSRDNQPTSTSASTEAGLHEPQSSDEPLLPGTPEPRKRPGMKTLALPTASLQSVARSFSHDNQCASARGSLEQSFVLRRSLPGVQRVSSLGRAASVAVSTSCSRQNSFQHTATRSASVVRWPSQDSVHRSAIPVATVAVATPRTSVLKSASSLPFLNSFSVQASRLPSRSTSPQPALHSHLVQSSYHTAQPFFAPRGSQEGSRYVTHYVQTSLTPRVPHGQPFLHHFQPYAVTPNIPNTSTTYLSPRQHSQSSDQQHVSRQMPLHRPQERQLQQRLQQERSVQQQLPQEHYHVVRVQTPREKVPQELPQLNATSIVATVPVPKFKGTLQG